MTTAQWHCPATIAPTKSTIVRLASLASQHCRYDWPVSRATNQQPVLLVDAAVHQRTAF